MKKMYSYFFYRAYDLVSTTGNFDLAWGASHLLSSFFCIAIVVVVYHSGMPLIGKQLEYIGIGVLFFSLQILNYFLFLKKDKYKEVLARYGQESRMRKRTGRLICVLLIMLLLYRIFTV